MALYGRLKWLTPILPNLCGHTWIYTYVGLWHTHGGVYFQSLKFPLTYLRIHSITRRFLIDVQNDAKNVPVDDDSLVRKIAVLRTFQWSVVPDERFDAHLRQVQV